MASVWKRLQRVNKRAAKFQYTASYHRIDLETTAKWKPNKLSIVWTRRSRRVTTEPQEWEPSLKDPLKGSVIFNIPVNHTVAVTLFKDTRTNELEDKDWTFVLEDVSSSGKRRRVGWCSINMRQFASVGASQRPLRLALQTRARAVQASIHLTLHCSLLREGAATDEDMQSLASLLSVNNNSDIAVLDDLDEDDYTLSDHSTKQMLDLRQQMEELTSSLTSSEQAATPDSVQSLALDRTPTNPLPTLPTLSTPTQPAPTPTKPDKDDNHVIITSTPIAEDNAFRGLNFKPKTIAKRNLKPLDLKTNLNNIGLDKNDNKSEDTDKTPTADSERAIFPDAVEKDKTPVGDLLWWCQSVTSEYPCRVRDLADSFRSGLAFCAIIHRHRPELIDFSGLQPEEAERNVRVALAAGAALGLPAVLRPADVLRPAPDRLAIMTYLFQLRAYFTGNELQVEQLGNEETESSYLVGRHDTDGSLPGDLFSREVSARRSRHKGYVPRLSFQPLKSPEKISELSTSPLEPIPARPEKLMTRKELTDPFGSDEEEESPPAYNSSKETPKTEQKSMTEAISFDPLTSPDKLNQLEINRLEPVESQSEPDRVVKLPSPELPKPTPQLLSRHDELKEKARQLLEATKREAREKDRLRKQGSKEKDTEQLKENGVRNGDSSPKKPMSEEERQVMLRERARKLIADARAGIVSPQSPSRPRPALEVITKQSLMEEIAAAGGVELEALSPLSGGSRRSSGSPDQSEDRVSSGRSGRSSPRQSPLRSFSALVERLTPDKDNPDEGRESGSYLSSELEALEREQAAVDQRAAALERQLRAAIDTQRHLEEDRLLTQWFNLVNKKNALLRRQMQLNILEQEEDLSRRCELLARELRLSLGVDEWRKTPEQKRRERLLLQELLAAVNERDRLVQEMDEQEKAIADDDAIERNLSQVEIQRKNNCILQ